MAWAGLTGIVEAEAEEAPDDVFRAARAGFFSALAQRRISSDWPASVFVLCEAAGGDGAAGGGGAAAGNGAVAGNGAAAGDGATGIVMATGAAIGTAAAGSIRAATGAGAAAVGAAAVGAGVAPERAGAAPERAGVAPEGAATGPRVLSDQSSNRLFSVGESAMAVAFGVARISAAGMTASAA